MDGSPFLCFPDRLFELRSDIGAYGELDPAESFMQFPALAPVAVGEKLVLVACRIRAETHGLYP
jgi:hypothetical protein